ncbi:MAG: glycosyltransferase family 4 protein [Anaerolineae bacterium]|nr:glycosyltransferase family 4 protein [Anaerolineae bacterium]
MRIGLVSGEYPPDQGGVGDFTREIGKALAALGHDVHVITGKSQIVRLSAHDEVANLKSQIAVHREVSNWDWGCWKQIRQIAQRERLDVLNVQFQTAAYGMHPAINLVPKRRSRPPVAATFHDLKEPYLFPKAGALRWWVIKTLAQRAEGVIVTNIEDEIKISGLQSPISNLVRIPIGSNITPRLPGAYDRALWRKRWKLGPDDLLLGYFGFLNERKGGEDLIETLAALAARGLPAHLLFIGGRVGSSDPANLVYAKQVERLVAERGLEHRVHYTDFVPAEEVSASLEAVDACVLPYRDGVSLRHGSLHACLAHGKPIVTTRPAVETPEVRDGENVLLAPAEDIAALADGVARLAADAELRTRLEKGALTLAAEFTWDHIASRTAEFLAELIA